MLGILIKRQLAGWPCVRHIANLNKIVKPIYVLMLLWLLEHNMLIVPLSVSSWFLWLVFCVLFRVNVFMVYVVWFIPTHILVYTFYLFLMQQHNRIPPLESRPINKTPVCPQTHVGLLNLNFFFWRIRRGNAPTGYIYILEKKRARVQSLHRV